MKDEYLVLIVEDDQCCADLLKYMLIREGYRVEIAQDGLTAQNIISKQKNPPHLVLLSLMLPFVDGYQLLQQIRRRQEWVDTPVIFLSSNTHEQDIVRAFELGASDYVTKPFQLGELLARIRSKINRKQQHG